MDSPVMYDLLIDMDITSADDLLKYCFLAGARAAAEFSDNLDFAYSYYCMPKIMEVLKNAPTNAYNDNNPPPLAVRNVVE